MRITSLWLVTGQRFFTIWLSPHFFTAHQLVSHGKAVKEREREQEGRGEAAPTLISHALSFVPHPASEKQVTEQHELNGRRIRTQPLKRVVLNNLCTYFDHSVLLAPYPLN